MQQHAVQIDRKHVPTLVQEQQLNRYLVLENLRH